jgi:UDP-N-acetylglucosamine 2-epimerase (non-hydrolysing)
MKLCIIAGARPNFMKISPIVDAIRSHNRSSDQQIGYFIVHTGQHYDEKMSKFFFDDLEIPSPDINLEVGSASHAVQVAEIMIRFEKVCLDHNPTHVLVVGDVNSTIACSLVASKIQYDSRQHRSTVSLQNSNGLRPLIAHVEAGLRSFDRSMPEEINRVLTDAISDLLFTTEESANENLRREGISEEKIHFVGNVMIDSLLKHKKKAEQSNILYSLGLVNSRSNDSTNQVNRYAVLTLHRPSNVDHLQSFQGIIEALTEVSEKIPIIFPAHPRTLNRIKEFDLENHFDKSLGSGLKIVNRSKGIHCVDSLGYLDFLQLMSNAKLVLTDSGGIQEETTILGIPCVTIRENTERPVTVLHGTNVVAGVKKGNIVDAAFSQLDRPVTSLVPPLWDGKAAERIVNILCESVYLSTNRPCKTVLTPMQHH